MKSLLAVSLSLYITLLAAPAYAATVTLSWTPPTQYTDGTAISALSGYNVYDGSTKIGSAAANATTFPANVAFGPHAFSVTAVAVNGNESAMSNVVNKTVPDTRTPKPPTLLDAVIAFLKRLFGHFA